MKTQKSDVLTTIAEYTPEQALALAIVNYEHYGFVRSGQGYNVYDDQGVYTHSVPDSKTLLISQMESQVVPHSEYVKQAKEIIDKFNGRFMMKKLNNSMNDFENGVAAAFAAGNQMTKFHVAIIASIPNMNEVDKKRKQVEDRLESLRFTSENFGTVRERYDITVEVIDCKFIQNSGVYMITTVHNNKDVIKFWWRDQPDINDIIEGKNIRIRGTVNKHENNRFTQTKETMMNRVKVTV